MQLSNTSALPLCGATMHAYEQTIANATNSNLAYQKICPIGRTAHFQNTACCQWAVAWILHIENVAVANKSVHQTMRCCDSPMKAARTSQQNAPLCSLGATGQVLLECAPQWSMRTFYLFVTSCKCFCFLFGLWKNCLGWPQIGPGGCFSY